MRLIIPLLIIACSSSSSFLSSTCFARTRTATTAAASTTMMKQASSALTLDMQSIRAPMQATQLDMANRGWEWRAKALKTLRRVVKENQSQLEEALFLDLGKHPTESIATEISVVTTEIDFALKNLRKWMRPKLVPSPGFAFPSATWVERVPISSAAGSGCGVLVIAPYNYPVQLTLLPAVGSLAAGNPTVLKPPTDSCPHVSRILHTLVTQHFAPGVLQVVQGGAETSQQLLSQQNCWGTVLFTGSPQVGRLVAQQCAATLTPCVLELGGQCPAVVDESITTTTTTDDTTTGGLFLLLKNHRNRRNQDILKSAAHRIIWAKTINAGQTCVAINHLLVHESKIEALLPLLEDALELQFPGSTRSRSTITDSNSVGSGQAATTTTTTTLSELGHMPTEQHAQRLVDMLREVEDRMAKSKHHDDTNANNNIRIIGGGSRACHGKYVAPTIVVNCPTDCRLWREELFGPILPIRSFASRNDAIQQIHSMNHHPNSNNDNNDDTTPTTTTPLALYVFGSKQAFTEITRACPSGSAARNDAVLQLASPHMPLAGRGSSGSGVYHGKHSFESFTHPFYTMERPLGMLWEFAMARYHPYGYHHADEASNNRGNNTNTNSTDDERQDQLISQNNNAQRAQSWKSWIVEHILLKLPMVPALFRYRPY